MGSDARAGRAHAALGRVPRSAFRLARGVRRLPGLHMRMGSRLSLRWRLTLGFGLAFAAILLALFLTLHEALGRILLHDVDDELSTYSEQIASQAADPDVMGSTGRLRELVRSTTVGGLVTNPSLTAIRNTHGQVLAQSPDIRQLDEITPTRQQIPDLRKGATVYRTIRTDGGRQMRVATTPIRIEGRIVGVVQTGQSLEGLLAAGDRLQVLLIGEGVLGLMLAAGAGYVFARRGLKPLDHVVSVAADIEANDLNRRLRMREAPTEVQALADTFDAMLDRLECSFAQQRSFVLDVSHELRTPLTALRGNIDVLLMDPTLTPEMRAQLERMSAETGRLIRLAANLLYLAQSDTGKQVVLGPVDLDLLCLDVVQQALVLKPGVRLRLGNEDQITVLGDRDLLKQLLLNLVENGLTYTPPGGQVTISLYREGRSAIIVVRDTGVGIAADDLPHIFERFYRAERTRRRAAGGAGVGLAIVDWVAKLHNGSVSVASTPGEGSVFTVRLPLLAAAGDDGDQGDIIPSIETTMAAANAGPPAAAYPELPTNTKHGA